MEMWPCSLRQKSWPWRCSSRRPDDPAVPAGPQLQPPSLKPAMSQMSLARRTDELGNWLMLPGLCCHMFSNITGSLKGGGARRGDRGSPRRRRHQPRSRSRRARDERPRDDDHRPERSAGRRVERVRGNGGPRNRCEPSSAPRHTYTESVRRLQPPEPPMEPRGGALSYNRVTWRHFLGLEDTGPGTDLHRTLHRALNVTALENVAPTVENLDDAQRIAFASGFMRFIRRLSRRSFRPSRQGRLRGSPT